MESVPHLNEAGKSLSPVKRQCIEAAPPRGGGSRGRKAILLACCEAVEKLESCHGICRDVANLAYCCLTDLARDFSPACWPYLPDRPAGQIERIRAAFPAPRPLLAGRKGQATRHHRATASCRWERLRQLYEAIDAFPTALLADLAPELTAAADAAWRPRTQHYVRHWTKVDFLRRELAVAGLAAVEELAPPLLAVRKVAEEWKAKADAACGAAQADDGGAER